MAGLLAVGPKRNASKVALLAQYASKATMLALGEGRPTPVKPFVRPA